ncbi:MAG TPA: hypothetical protein VIN10_08755, partial [Bacteroidales bacterium]
MFTVLILLTFFYLFKFSLSSFTSQATVAEKFQNNLVSLIDLQKSTAQILRLQITSDQFSNWNEIDKLLEQNKISAYIYLKDSLIYWNTQLGEFYFDQNRECEYDT